jgi:nicotinate-nucleotide pyrophosphorylase (carboxylating)
MTLLDVINLALDEDLIQPQLDPISASTEPPAHRASSTDGSIQSDDARPVDLTGSLLEDHDVELALVARAPGVFVGQQVIPLVLALTAQRLGYEVPNYEALLGDGDPLEATTEIATISGSLRAILAAERTLLNLTCHLSGVATLTRTYATKVAHTSAKIRDTRKTTPGLRLEEKHAVRCGGGVNHRLGLWDAFLIKDNHLAYGSLADLVTRARLHQPARPIEVEVDDLDQLDQAVELGLDLILLDNMDVDTISEAVKRVRGRCRLEVSGGVSLDNVVPIAETGVDYIAIGALTHSAPILDLGLDDR